MSDISRKQRSVLLIGGPDAGKSNYLFRFWIAVDEQAGLLTKDGLPSDIEYLRAGAERLLAGEFAERTPTGVRDATVIPVKGNGAAAGFGGSLVVPDVAGEQVMDVFAKRGWPQDWEDFIDEGCGCLLFVRAGSDELVAPLDWITCFDLYEAAPPPAAPDGGGGDEEVKIATQVVMVDWLQFLRAAFTARVADTHRPRVGLVVSAWDLVPKSKPPIRPSDWLTQNLPMLAQFVEANDDEFDFAIFGVSATSGDLLQDTQFQQAFIEKGARHFGFVLHERGGAATRTDDLTLPVAWALGLSPGETEERSA